MISKQEQEYHHALPLGNTKAYTICAQKALKPSVAQNFRMPYHWSWAGDSSLMRRLLNFDQDSQASFTEPHTISISSRDSWLHYA